MAMTREEKNQYIRDWKRAKRSDEDYKARELARDTAARLTRSGSRSADRARTVSPEMEMVYSARARAKVKGIPCNIEASDVQIPALCPVLGIPLVRHAGEGRGGKPNSPSLDRVDPKQGYVKGNVRVISQRANTIKQDASVAEVEAVIAYMKREGCP